MKSLILVLAVLIGSTAVCRPNTNSVIEQAGQAALNVVKQYEAAHQAKLAQTRKEQQDAARLAAQQQREQEQLAEQQRLVEKQQKQEERKKHMEAFFALFAIGTLWFWILMAAVAITITAFIENERFVFPTILSGIMLAIYWKAIHEVFNWRALLLLALIYTVAGCLWSIFRWFRHCRDVSNSYKTRYGTSLTADRHDDLVRETTVGRYKSKVTSWIAFWPMSMFWNIFGDILTALYENMVKIYTSISRRHVAQFTKMSETEEATARSNPRRF